MLDQPGKISWLHLIVVISDGETSSPVSSSHVILERSFLHLCIYA